MAFNVPDDLTAGVDLDEVRRALGVLIPPGHTFELRSLPVARSCVSKDIESALSAVPSLATGTGLYYTINPVRPDLTGAASNVDILERWWMLVDVDSVRPQPVPPAEDINATEGERREAGKLAEMVKLDLKSRGFSEPVVVDSGNGFHLLYRISLPNDPLSSLWVQATLKKLAELYNTAGAKVDISVHNASRISRLPGTWNRKGPSTPDRPHRMARLVSVPESVEPVDVEALRKFSGVNPAEPIPGPKLAAWTVPPVGTAGDPTAWFRKAIEHETGRVAMTPAGDRHNALRAATRTLAGYLHHGFISETEIRSALKLAGERAGLDPKDVADTIEWGVENGKANPLPWPTKLTTAPAGAPKPGAGGEQVSGQSGRTYAFPLTVKGSSVTPKKVHWLWQDRIPYGFLTLFAGMTGVGKSFVTLDITARITAGEEVPLSAGECFTPSSCLYIGEDSHDYILTPRLIEAGADMDRVSFMSWEAMAVFTLGDTEMLNDVYAEAGSPKFVVIDPPTNFLGAKDEHKNAEVRGVLMGVSIWAMKHDIACVMITHCNKGIKKDMAALDRIIGSVAWASTSRIAHIFSPHPDEEGQGIFVGAKSNLGKRAKGLTYEIQPTATLARVNWIGNTTLSADDALSGEKKEKKAVGAVKWLAERFGEKRDWPSDELKQAAKEAGYDHNALWSPEVNALPIRKHPIVTAAGDRVWVWSARDGWPPEN